MAATWEELIIRYGSPKSIPNPVLYEYITRSDVMDSIVSLRKIPGALEKRDLYIETRRRAKQDLMFLSRYFLWDKNPFNYTGDMESNLIREETHQILADFFVHKDDSKPIKQQDTHKDRLLLYPRGSAKSTIDSHDVVQWVLNFPYIRILYMTSVQDLADGFVEETKGYFTVVPDAKPSLMALFFPEFCGEEKQFKGASEFWCPVFTATGKKRKEPTVYGLGIDANMSGWHFELIKADDCVSTDNSQNETSNKKVAHNFNINKKMLVPGGYCDLVGTRYSDEGELYYQILENNVGVIHKENPHPNVELIENTTTGQLILIGKAVQIRPETAAELEKAGKPITYKEAGEDGCIVLLPDLIPYGKFMVDLNTDEQAAESQYNQTCRPAGRTTFDRPLLDSCTVDFRQIPTAGIRTQTWDFAFSQKKRRDYCTCSSVVWSDDGTCYVQDLVRDRFSPSDLAKAVVQMAKKWKPVVIGIEDAGGSKLLEPSIISEAYKTSDPQVIAVCAKIDWIPVDRSPDAKRTRMAALHPILVERRMLFSNHLPFLDVLYDEFERCLTSSSHDDVPDVLSYQPRFGPKVRSMIASQYKAPLTREDAIAQATYNLLYGEWLVDDPTQMMNAYGKSVPIPMEPEPPEPEIEIEAQSQIPGVISPLGSGLVG